MAKSGKGSAIALTRQMVDSAKAREAHYRLHDAKVPGLALRVWPSGVKAFAVTWARNRELTIGRHPVMTLEAARIKALSVLGDAAKHGTPSEAKPKEKISTLRDFIEKQYEPWVTVERKAGKATVAAIKATFADFLDKPLTAISAFGVEKFKADRLRNGIMPATVNRDLIRIRAALSKAVEWHVLAEHPLRGVKSAKGADDSRVRYLDADEEKRLRKALDERETVMRKARLSGNAWAAERGRETRRVWKKDEFVDHVAPLVLLALNTGLRRGELFGLSWDAVDVDRAMLTVKADTAKSGNARHVPLNAEAKDVLKRWKKQGSAEGLVFPGVEGGRMTNINKSWATLMTRAKLTDFRFHDCRHHFASRLVMAGTSLFVVKTLLGHSTIEMTERYSHLAPEHLSDAVEKLVTK
jgi:integrase